MFTSKRFFFCIGAQKAGTSTIHEILRSHPEIYMPISEAPFFYSDDLFNKGTLWFKEKYFKDYNNETILGTKTPEYIYITESIKNIQKTFGNNVKFILSLRNPVDRAFSHYLMTYRRGLENLPFLPSLSIEKERIEKSIFNKIHYSYITRGLYFIQIRNFLKYYDRKKLFILIFEKDLINESMRIKTFKKIQDFLSINQINLNTNIKKNPASLPRNLFFSRIKNDPQKFKIFRQNLPNILKNNKLVDSFLESIEKKNLTTSNNIIDLDIKRKRYYYNKYFKKDIEKLENLLRINLDIWKFI
ncbi:MAG: sulfotransferase domain-containing protein [Candidatus Lokiarchaeota archaeon]|nr:sulfotransferase domain-containing protein [Candidatus Harpocratesius repetitus]